MAYNCKQCEYFNEDYIFDEEIGDEFPLFSCDKGHDDELFSDCKCPYFEEYRPINYIERDTNCDKCPKLKDCISSGNVLRTTIGVDTREHYIMGIGSHCKQDFSMIMSAIKDGAGVPEEINEALRHYGIEEI